MKSPEPLRYAPTAVQAVRDEQPMLFRKKNWVPAGLGVGWIVHLVPFHRSARAPAFDNPAAVHDVRKVQLKPSNPAPPCDDFGVGWIRHLVPFHLSARVPLPVCPTAVHADVVVHETSSR
jgi:hypothetical protein